MRVDKVLNADNQNTTPGARSSYLGNYFLMILFVWTFDYLMMCASSFQVLCFKQVVLHFLTIKYQPLDVTLNRYPHFSYLAVALGSRERRDSDGVMKKSNKR
jgi:hypothetical protein